MSPIEGVRFWVWVLGELISILPIIFVAFFLVSWRVGRKSNQKEPTK